MRAPMAASSEVQVAVFVDVDLHILADLPAPETVGVGVPEPVDANDGIRLRRDDRRFSW